MSIPAVVNYKLSLYVLPPKPKIGQNPFCMLQTQNLYCITKALINNI